MRHMGGCCCTIKRGTQSALLRFSLVGLLACLWACCHILIMTYSSCWCVCVAAMCSMQGVVAPSNIELCVRVSVVCVWTQMSHAYAAVGAAWMLPTCSIAGCGRTDAWIVLCCCCCCWMAPFVDAAVCSACLSTAAGVCKPYYTTTRFYPRFMSLFSGAALSTMRGV
jgi:hypothetical protein